SPLDQYIDEIAPASIVGRMVKFSKEGKFVTHDDGEPVSETVEFIALVPETLGGWIRFHKDGETPPDRVQGLLYDGFKPPPGETLGDLDRSKWNDGLNGEPEDPWKHQLNLVLQMVGTQEMFTFVTTSESGRRAVGSLMRHYNRMRQRHPDELPVVKLKPG